MGRDWEQVEFVVVVVVVVVDFGKREVPFAEVVAGAMRVVGELRERVWMARARVAM